MSSWEGRIVVGLIFGYEAARETGIRLVVGCRLDLLDGTSLLVYPTDRLPMPGSAAC